VQAWIRELGLAATNSQHLLHPLVQPEARTNRIEPDATEPLGLRVIADYTRPAVQPWKADGEAFGAGPLASGSVVAGLSEAQPIARILDLGAAHRDASPTLTGRAHQDAARAFISSTVRYHRKFIAS
jgi:hypothetical protein